MYRNRDFPFAFRARVTFFIIALNVLVFVGWVFAEKTMNGFMAKNFLVSWSALEEGRYWTLITSVFSHIAFLHIFLNMFVLRSFGPIVERALGQGRYLRFYLGAGVVASLGHSLVSAFVLGNPGLPALGASGAISGVILLFSLMFPKERILIFGIIPAPAIWGVFFLVGLDLWGLFEQAHGAGLPIGHGAHLGGALAGAVYYFAFIRGARKNA